MNWLICQKLLVSHIRRDGINTRGRNPGNRINEMYQESTRPGGWIPIVLVIHQVKETPLAVAKPRFSRRINVRAVA